MTTKLAFNQIGNNVVNVMDKGASTISVDNSAAIQSAIDEVEAAGGGTVYIPANTTLNIKDSGSQALLIDSPNVRLVGEGVSSKLIYTSSTTSTPAVRVTADNVSIFNLHIDGTPNATKSAEVRSGCVNILVEDSDNCEVSGCSLEGGHYGVQFKSTTGDWTTNLNNKATNNRIYNGFSSGIDTRRAEGLILSNNYCYDRGTDGIKCAEGTRYATVEGNLCFNNTRDGIDFYDGLIESTVTGNNCFNNTLFGFECKGTFDGTYTAGDYVFINNTITGNIARGNGDDGFGIISVRNCTFTGNQSVSNAQDGFDISTTQGCSFTGNVATRNTQHGFDCSGSATNNLFSGCYAIDNSWVDGTTQNGTYDGFNVASGCAAEFVGCEARNGTTTGKKGGQGYGITFASGTSSVIGGNFGGNVTGDIDGQSFCKIVGVRDAAGAYMNSFGSWTSNADAAVNGYVTFVDDAGTTRKLATIA